MENRIAFRPGAGSRIQIRERVRSNWEPEVAKLPVVISFPGTELKSRDVVIGLTIAGAARAYPWETFVKQSPVLDRVNGTPLLLVLGPDGKSFRVFVSRIDGRDAEFFLQGDDTADPPAEKKAWTLVDATRRANGTFKAAPPPVPLEENA